jgi:phosphatidylserine/phosphatidylglycerophosphate/cardiolipin synthase-like enzyme
MCHHRRLQTVTVLWWTLMLLCLWFGAASAHQDPCHRLHSCPSDTGSYTCGDKGRCDQYPDNQACLGGKPRVASSVNLGPAPRVPSPHATTTPSAVIVCFTPGGNCTDAIVQALNDAKHTILVQAYSFTSAPIAKALLDAHKRGVQKYRSSSIRASARRSTPRPTFWRTREYRP